jgi:BASS family bile acid:Na+ symporter
VLILQKLVPIALLTFVLSSMLAMGLSLTIGQIIAPLRNTRLVVFSLVANFVLMPLAAIGFAALLRLDQPLGVGLLLLRSSAGAPFLPKLTQLAKGNLAFAVGLMGAVDGYHGWLPAAGVTGTAAGSLS